MSSAPKPQLSDFAVEEQALRAMWEQFEERYSQRDAEGVANLFAPDSDRINHQGQLAQGRHDVQKQYEAIFQDETDPVIQSSHAALTIRFLRPDVALLDGRWKADGPHGTIEGGFTVTATKENNRWCIAAGRDRGVIISDGDEKDPRWSGLSQLPFSR
ncbi:MAG: SgcJ/EcaC family oxidoreductase [Candidatus Tectomicrobia bacterium]|nr:SgcJ/EcaC family oxidoreductase [Candidatus Tectomicrobia bacterium]